MKMHVISSGSKGNASLIYNDDVLILVDMGISKKRLIEGLKEIQKDIDSINAFLITHEHGDHISGIHFLPLELRYCKGKTVEVIKGHSFKYFQKFNISSIEVTVLKTSHDAISPCGFLFLDLKTNEKLVYLTDTGYIPVTTEKYLMNCDYYFIESNHDVDMLLNSDRPISLKNRILSLKGHLSNNQSAEYLSKFIGEKTKRITLAHLSDECNEPDIAMKTLIDKLDEEGITHKNILIQCASEYESVDVC